MLEIERKFLVDDMPDLNQFSFNEIEQGYLSFAPEIRIRKKGNQFFITRKGDGTKIREEVETEINETTYTILSGLVKGNIISKTRYKVPLNDSLTAELDVYYGMLKDLLTVEVEFTSKEQSDNFVIPSWFGMDITEDKRYKNKNLAQIDSLDSLLKNKDIKTKKTSKIV